MNFFCKWFYINSIISLDYTHFEMESDSVKESNPATCYSRPRLNRDDVRKRLNLHLGQNIEATAQAHASERKHTDWYKQMRERNNRAVRKFRERQKERLKFADDLKLLLDHAKLLQQQEYERDVANLSVPAAHDYNDDDVSHSFT